jgi:hypothetical protein
MSELRRNNRSGCNGVYWSTRSASLGRKPWIVEYALNGDRRTKSYATFDEAVTARREWETEHATQLGPRRPGPVPSQRIPYVLTDKAIVALDRSPRDTA